MNVTRIAILGVAAVAAGAAALLVRGMLGGATPEVSASVPAPVIATADVLVAAKEIEPGRALSVDSVRWETWPETSVADAFITKTEQPDTAKAVEGYVVRAPIVTGQPITEAFVVRAGQAGFLAALIKPGMRAISVVVSPETGAGGFILPNDRVDVILTRDLPDEGTSKNIRSDTILRDVRVLAVDQTSQTQVAAKDAPLWAIGKTATLELTPGQSEMIGQAIKEGTLSLALRALGDDRQLPAYVLGSGVEENGIRVFRAGVLRKVEAGAEGSPE